MSTESSDNVVPTATTLTEESTTFLPGDYHMTITCSDYNVAYYNADESILKI